MAFLFTALCDARIQIIKIIKICFCCLLLSTIVYLKQLLIAVVIKTLNLLIISFMNILF